MASLRCVEDLVNKGDHVKRLLVIVRVLASETLILDGTKEYVTRKGCGKARLLQNSLNDWSHDRIPLGFRESGCCQWIFNRLHEG